MANNDPSEQAHEDRTRRFELIRQWPEGIGSRAWRSRAAKELSATEFESFLIHGASLVGLSQAEREAISHEWEVFNSAQGKKYQRQKFIRDTLEFVDAGAAVISVFGVLGLIGWLTLPGMFDDELGTWWLYFHLPITAAYGLSLLIRLPKVLRDRLNSRHDDKIDYSRMKNDVAYLNGQYLAGDLVPKSADEIAIQKTAGRVLNVLVVVFVVGFIGALDAPKGYMPLWLSIVLMILGVLGSLLAVRLRALAERLQNDLDRALARERNCPDRTERRNRS